MGLDREAGGAEVWTASRLYNVYQAQEDIYRQAAKSFEDLVAEVLLSADVTPSILESRHKKPAELYKKQLKKAFPDPWVDCPDLIGVRVVLPLSSQKSVVAAALEVHPDLVETVTVDKTDELEPTDLKYAGLHVQTQHFAVINAQGRPIRCEIQVRTIAEHTWAETEHKYIYKKPIEIPRSARRIFARSLVLVELLDEELRKGVEMVESLESYSELKLARELEDLFLSVGGSGSDEQLTLENIHTLCHLDLGSPTDLIVSVRDYVAGHSEDLRKLLHDHGPSSDGFSIESDWITTQPESLLLLAMLDRNEYQLSNSLKHTELFDQAEPLALWTNHMGFLQD